MKSRSQVGNDLLRAGSLKWDGGGGPMVITAKVGRMVRSQKTAIKKLDVDLDST